MGEPYAEAAMAYHRAGWTGALPLPPEEKSPPPEGWTGHHAPYPSGADVQAWTEEHPAGNIGLRLPPGVLGVDVDAYGMKPGAATLAITEARIGELPPTWMITARDDGISGIRLYRVPVGLNWRGGLPGIDTIHSGHRYAVAPPSIHPEGGVYRWVDSVTGMGTGMPNPTELPELPLAWVAELVQPYARTEGADLTDAAVRDWLDGLRTGEMCRPVATVLEREMARVTNPAGGSRHDITRDALRALVAFGGEGHAGVQGAIITLAETFRAAATSSVRGSARSELQAAAEWSRLRSGAVRLAAAKNAKPAQTCDCTSGEQQADDLAAIMGGPDRVNEVAVAAPPNPPPDDRSGNPARFFASDGLQMMSLTRAVEAAGPLATDLSGRLYRYADGVWLADGDRVVRGRVVDLLGDRYRMMHAANVVDVLRTREPLVDDERMDTDHLNLPNGLLDWRRYQLRPHDPAVPSTIRLPVEWEPTATCPEIDKWIGEVFPADAREFVEEVIGYALYNDNPLHKAILLFGRGRNGKGTFLRLLKALIGSRNISAVTPQSLDDNRFRAAELYGKVANLVGDVDPRIFKATETFKQVTGGDMITAERKHGQPFQFTCRALMFAAFNALPRSADTSEGFFSRWIVVPFIGYFPPGKADPSREAKMHTEAELRGLLVLAVRGLNRVMGRGRFELPASVLAETADFRRVADPVRAFLEEWAVGRENGSWVPRTEVYRRYVTWSGENGYHAVAASVFYERVEAAAADIDGIAITARTRQGTRGYLLSVVQRAEPGPGAAEVQRVQHLPFSPTTSHAHVEKRGPAAPSAPSCTLVCLGCSATISATEAVFGICGGCAA